MDWRRANKRWERLIEIVEAMDFVEGFRAAGTERTYRVAAEPVERRVNDQTYPISDLDDAIIDAQIVSRSA